MSVLACENGGAAGERSAGVHGAATCCIFWHPDTKSPTLDQYWVFNNTSGATDNNYVYNACNSASY